MVRWSFGGKASREYWHQILTPRLLLRSTPTGLTNSRARDIWRDITLLKCHPQQPALPARKERAAESHGVTYNFRWRGPALSRGQAKTCDVLPARFRLLQGCLCAKLVWGPPTDVTHLRSHPPMSRDVNFGGSPQKSSLVGAALAAKLKYVPLDARGSYFTQNILVGKRSELCNNINPENWCQ